MKDFDPLNAAMFYQKCLVITEAPFPEPVEIRGTESNHADLEEADVVITNVQQLQGQENRWLAGLPANFFDLILCDEGHHSKKQETLLRKSTVSFSHNCCYLLTCAQRL